MSSAYFLDHRLYLSKEGVRTCTYTRTQKERQFPQAHTTDKWVSWPCGSRPPFRCLHLQAILSNAGQGFRRLVLKADRMSLDIYMPRVNTSNRYREGWLEGVVCSAFCPTMSFLWPRRSPDADGLLSVITATLRAISASVLAPLTPVTSTQDLLVKSVVRLCQAQPRRRGRLADTRPQADYGLQQRTSTLRDLWEQLRRRKKYPFLSGVW